MIPLKYSFRLRFRYICVVENIYILLKTQAYDYILLFYIYKNIVYCSLLDNLSELVISGFNIFFRFCNLFFLFFESSLF